MRFNTLRDPDGKLIGADQFVYDVTEKLHDHERLRHAEEALRQAQREGEIVYDRVGRDLAAIRRRRSGQG